MSKLVEERLTIHWAAQIIAAAASTRIEAKPDFSHTNFGFSHTHGALMTHPIGEVSAGLVLATLELIVETEGDVVARYALATKTLADGVAWLGAALDQRAGDRIALALPEHDMPSHPVGDGARFPEPGTAHAEVASWFATAHDVVTAVGEDNGDAASPARCWPHHFDLATLITIEPHDDPEHAKSVGFGLTPGDAGIAEPYFYATPWPRPDESELGELSVGEWHTRGWTGAVLKSVDPARARAFGRVAVEACRSLL